MVNDALDAIDGPARRHSSAARAVWERQWSSVIAPFLVQRTLLMCVVYFGSELVGVHRTWHALPRVPFLDVWLRWDAMYYLTIAMNGYANLGWGTNSPFFPLFPLLTVVFGAVMPKAIAALLVTNVAAVVALGFLYAWIERSFDERMARRAVQIALVFPTSFFLTAAYSESVYLLAAVGAMLAWSRNKQWLAALGVVLACLARPVGVLALTLPFVIQWLATSRRVREVPWFVAAASIGAGLVLLIYFASTGDPFAFAHAPQTESLGKYTGEHQAVHATAILWDEGWSQNLMRRLLNWSALGLIAAAAVHFLRQRRFDLALLTVLPALLPLAFQRSLLDAASMGRYALVGFPVFLALARWLPDGPKARALDSGFQMMQVVLAICFATARWAE